MTALRIDEYKMHSFSLSMTFLHKNYCCISIIGAWDGMMKPNIPCFSGGHFPWTFLWVSMQVFALRDVGSVKLSAVSLGVLGCWWCAFPWMIILCSGNTRACCATSWHLVLPSSICHLLPSVILSLHSSCSLPATLLQSSSLCLEMCLNNTKRHCLVRMAGSSVGGSF